MDATQPVGHPVFLGTRTLFHRQGHRRKAPLRRTFQLSLLPLGRDWRLQQFPQEKTGWESKQSSWLIIRAASADYYRIHESEDYTDLTVICGKDSYHVHKVVICSQSAWFKSACKKEWQSVCCSSESQSCPGTDNFESGVRRKITSKPHFGRRRTA